MPWSNVLNALFTLLATTLPAPWNVLVASIWSILKPLIGAGEMHATGTNPTPEQFRQQVRDYLASLVARMPEHGLIGRLLKRAAHAMLGLVSDSMLDAVYSKLYGGSDHPLLMATHKPDELTAECLDEMAKV